MKFLKKWWWVFFSAIVGGLIGWFSPNPFEDIKVNIERIEQLEQRVEQLENER